MQVLYPLYYRMHGIRRAVQLVAPPLSKEEFLNLPRDAILHYFSEEESMYGIPQDDPIVRQILRIIYVEHQTQLAGSKGPPRPTRLPASTMIRQYHRKYRRTRKLNNIDAALRDSRSLLVENYALLPHLYRYTTSYFSTYYKWWNIQTTMWKRVEELSQITDREQFLVCRIPTILPNMADLKRGERSMTRAALSRFADSDSLFILEIWKWLGANRAESVLSVLSPKALTKTNLIWVEGGHWFVMNLGLLEDWRRATEDEIDEGAEKGGIITAFSMQKRFLRLLMFLTELRSEAGEDSAGISTGSEVVQRTTPRPLGMVETPEAPADTSAAPVETKTPTKKSGKSTLEPMPDLDMPKTAKVTSHEPPVDITTTKVVVKPLSIKVANPEDSTKSVKLVLKPGMNIDNLPVDFIEETPENIKAIDDAITKDLEALNHLNLDELETVAGDDGLPEVLVPASYEPRNASLEEGVMAKADQLADAGLLSGAEYRRFTALSAGYKKLPDPYGNGSTLEEHLKIPKESLKLDDHTQIPKVEGVLDQSMLKSRLFDFDKQYLDDVLTKDISNAVMSVQRGGIAVTGYEVEHSEDALNNYEMHTVNLVPVHGKQSTVRFKLPTVSDDGTFVANGVRYRLRKQRGDVPIRKLDSDKVALTSYYAKMFVTRSSKQVHNYTGWLTNQIAAIGMDGDDNRITELMISDVYDTNMHVPRMYSIIAQRFRSFKLSAVTSLVTDKEVTLSFFFDFKARVSHFGKELIKAAERKGMFLVGTYVAAASEEKQPIVMDPNGTMYVLGLEAGDAHVKVLGTFESLLNLNVKRAPMEVVDIKIFGKQIPVGLFLAYQMGLEKLLATLKVTPRRVPAGERLHLSDDEFALTYSDEALVFTKDHSLPSLLLSGLMTFNDTSRNYSVSLFEKKDIYFNLLERIGLGVRYLREMDLLVDMFIDPITREILESMKEPTDFIGLLLRASEMLLTDWAPDETDMEYMRIKGYERMAGAVYSEMVKAIRLQRARGTNNATIDIPPYAIWQAVLQDPAVKLVEESNPVHNLKEQEEVTYTGTGGRTSRSMVGNTRSFHRNDMGVISEATKDSSDVAITTFLTADPNFKDVRGLTGRYKDKNLGAASLISTSALLAPAADRDDAKRVNFISIQQSAGTFAKDYRPTPLRTGYERVIAHRTDDLFATTAKEAGVVKQVSPLAITIEYKTGKSLTVQLGRRFGVAAGMVLPHQLVTGLKEGDKVAAGDLVAYNTHYFEPDPLDPKQALWKAGVLVKTAILESADTLEDSSAISERAAAQMETQVTKIREIVVTFDQSIRNILTVGQEVDSESILCTIEDAVTAQNNLLDDESLDVLKSMAANTPRAKSKGMVERVEMFYNGDMEDLSPSLQELARVSNQQRRREARALHRNYTSGQVDDSLRIDGNPLPHDNAVIRMYITTKVPAGVGDKGVFANQMKTVFGRVLAGRNMTESGTPIDAFFGFTSVSDRIVLSPTIIGTTNTLLKIVSKRVANVYFGRPV